MERRRSSGIGLAWLLAALFACAGCEERGFIEYGAGIIPSQGKTPIAWIRAQPGEYAGKMIKVEGLVTPAPHRPGTLLHVGDSSGSLLVDLRPAGFAVPVDECRGRRGFATGTVRVEDGQPRLEADGLRILLN